jgi:hypothetical protein
MGVRHHPAAKMFIDEAAAGGLGPAGCHLRVHECSTEWQDGRHRVKG